MSTNLCVSARTSAWSVVSNKCNTTRLVVSMKCNTTEAPWCVLVLEQGPQIWQLLLAIHSHLPVDPAEQICSKIQIWLLRKDLITKKVQQISDCRKFTLLVTDRSSKKLLFHNRLSFYNIIALPWSWLYHISTLFLCPLLYKLILCRNAKWMHNILVLGVWRFGEVQSKFDFS